MRTLYRNGTILTLDHEADRHEALVVENGAVAGVGDAHSMTALAGDGADVVDLDGAFALPGLIDSHPHAMHFTAYRVGAVDLTEALFFF